MNNALDSQIREEDFHEPEVLTRLDEADEILARMIGGWETICWNAYNGDGCDGAKDPQIFFNGSIRYGPCVDSPSDCVQLTRINLGYFE